MLCKSVVWAVGGSAGGEEAGRAVLQEPKERDCSNQASSSALTRLRPLSRHAVARVCGVVAQMEHKVTNAVNNGDNVTITVQPSAGGESTTMDADVARRPTATAALWSLQSKSWSC